MTESDVKDIYPKKSLETIYQAKESIREQTVIWHFDKSPVQKEDNSFMLAIIEGLGMCRIELGESLEQWKERDDRDWCHGDCGLTWLINGHPDANAETDMIAWTEIPKIF